VGAHIDRRYAADVANEDDDEEERGGTPASVGLSVIRARDVPIALVFRRGPTKQVRMVRWDMRTDEFQRGQWFAGRVYPYACELSPDGTYVDYQGTRRGNTWRAITKLPYFTPLAVWGATGWESSTDQPVPAWVPREPVHRMWPRGPVARDGFAPIEDAAPYRQRSEHRTLAGMELQRRDATPVMDGYASWTDRHSFVYRVVDRRSEAEYELSTADWAEWHPSGDIAVASDGMISRIPITRRGPGKSRVIADFTDETFEKLPPPPDATRW
jgi:hypothetical protein